MKRAQAESILLAISIFEFTLMSVSFVLMPFDSLKVLPGVLFWSGLLIGCGLQVTLEVRRRALFASYGVHYKQMQKPRNGLLSFKSNTPAMFADFILLISLPVSVLTFILTKGAGYICYIFLAINIYSFCLHCILNGRIYFYSKNQLKIRRMLEERKSKKKEGEGTI